MLKNFRRKYKLPDQYTDAEVLSVAREEWPELANYEDAEVEKALEFESMGKPERFGKAFKRSVGSMVEGVDQVVNAVIPGKNIPLSPNSAYSKFLKPEQNETPTPQGFAEWGTEIAGGFIPDVAAIGMISRTMPSAVPGALGRTAIGRLAYGVAKEAAVGGLYTQMHSYSTPKERMLSTAKNAALFGLMGGAGKISESIVNKVAPKMKLNRLGRAGLEAVTPFGIGAGLAQSGEYEDAKARRDATLAQGLLFAAPGFVKGMRSRAPGMRPGEVDAPDPVQRMIGPSGDPGGTAGKKVRTPGETRTAYDAGVSEHGKASAKYAEAQRNFRAGKMSASKYAEAKQQFEEAQARMEALRNEFAASENQKKAPPTQEQKVRGDYDMASAKYSSASVKYEEALRKFRKGTITEEALKAEKATFDKVKADMDAAETAFVTQERARAAAAPKQPMPTERMSRTADKLGVPRFDENGKRRNAEELHRDIRRHLYPDADVTTGEELATTGTTSPAERAWKAQNIHDRRNPPPGGGSPTITPPAPGDRAAMNDIPAGAGDTAVRMGISLRHDNGKPKSPAWIRMEMEQKLAEKNPPQQPKRTAGEVSKRFNVGVAKFDADIKGMSEARKKFAAGEMTDDDFTAEQTRFRDAFKSLQELRKDLAENKKTQTEEKAATEPVKVDETQYKLAAAKYKEALQKFGDGILSAKDLDHAEEAFLKEHGKIKKADKAIVPAKKEPPKPSDNKRPPEGGGGVAVKTKPVPPKPVEPSVKSMIPDKIAPVSVAGSEKAALKPDQRSAGEILDSAVIRKTETGESPSGRVYRLTNLYGLPKVNTKGKDLSYGQLERNIEEHEKGLKAKDKPAEKPWIKSTAPTRYGDEAAKRMIADLPNRTGNTRSRFLRATPEAEPKWIDDRVPEPGRLTKLQQEARDLGIEITGKVGETYSDTFLNLRIGSVRKKLGMSKKANDDIPSLYSLVMKAGGIKPDPHTYGEKDLTADLGSKIVRKNGREADILVSLAQEAGYYEINSTDDLMAALKNERRGGGRNETQMNARYDKQLERAAEEAESVEREKGAKSEISPKSNWRQRVDAIADLSEKSPILRAIANDSKSHQELLDVLKRVPGVADENNIRWAVYRNKHYTGTEEQALGKKEYDLRRKTQPDLAAVKEKAAKITGKKAKKPAVKKVEAEAPAEGKQPWKMTSISRQDGGVLISASIKGKEAGSVIIANLGDGVYELNEIHVGTENQRQGLGTELYRKAAQAVAELNGKLYTSSEMTESGRMLRDSISKAGGLGDTVRIKGAHRNEILPTSAKSAEKETAAERGAEQSGDEISFKDYQIENAALKTPEEWLKDFEYKSGTLVDRGSKQWMQGRVHQVLDIGYALDHQQPINAAAFEKYSKSPTTEFWRIKLPKGYIKEGDKYVFRETLKPTEAPASQGEAIPAAPEPKPAERMHKPGDIISRGELDRLRRLNAERGFMAESGMTSRNHQLVMEHQVHGASFVETYANSGQFRIEKYDGVKWNPEEPSAPSVAEEPKPATRLEKPPSGGKEQITLTEMRGQAEAPKPKKLTESLPIEGSKGMELFGGQEKAPDKGGMFAEEAAAMDRASYKDLLELAKRTFKSPLLNGKPDDLRQSDITEAARALRARGFERKGQMWVNAEKKISLGSGGIEVRGKVVDIEKVERVKEQIANADKGKVKVQVLGPDSPAQRAVADMLGKEAKIDDLVERGFYRDGIEKQSIERIEALYAMEEVPPYINQSGDKREWEALNGYDKEKFIGLNAKLKNDPDFIKLKEAVDKISKRNGTPVYSKDEALYLNTDIGDQALQDKIAKKHGITFFQGTFKGRRSIIPEPKEYKAWEPGMPTAAQPPVIDREKIERIKKKVNQPAKENLAQLMERYRQAGHVVFHHPRNKTVAIDGFPAVSEKDAAKQIREGLEEIPQPVKPAQPAGALGVLQEQDSFIEKMNEGRITVDELKQHFQQTAADKGKIIAELSKLTKKELDDKFGGYHYSDAKKEDLVRSAYESILMRHNPTDVVTYNPHGGSFEKALEDKINKATAEDLKKSAAEYQERKKERLARYEQYKKSLTNPETLEEFETFFKYRKAEKLTPEQQERYDALKAGADFEKRGKLKAAAAERGAEKATTELNITAGTHTKKGTPIWTVTMANRVERAEYDNLNASAKTLGGYYSAWKGGGAKPGFIFNDAESAQKFVTENGGRMAEKAATLPEKAPGRQTKLEHGKHYLGILPMPDGNGYQAVEITLKNDMEGRSRVYGSKLHDGYIYKTMTGADKYIEEYKNNPLFQHLEYEKLPEFVEQSMMQGGLYGESAEAEPGQAPKASSDIIKNAQRLRTMAENTEEKGTEVLNADRQTNTWRRANIASGMEKKAEAEIKWAKTLLNIADAVETGEVKFLAEMSQGTQLTALNEIYRDAEQGIISRDPATYPYRENNDGPKPPVGEVIRQIKFPRFYSERDFKKGVLNDLEKAGKKMLAIRLNSKIKNIHPIQADFVNEIIKALGKDAPWQWKATSDKIKRLEKMGITNSETLRMAIRELMPLQAAGAQQNRIKTMERALIGRKIEGYFPTPVELASNVVDLANIQPGMTVLEPSAGKGNLADAVRLAHPDAQIEVIEPVDALREILTEKGYKIVARSYDDIEYGHYDRVVMNPPFEKGQDMAHVIRNYNQLLNPGGRLVSIMSAGSFQRSDVRTSEFKEWLESIEKGKGHYSIIDNPEGSFKSAERPTGVNTKILILDKPGGEAQHTTAGEFADYDAVKPGDAVKLYDGRTVVVKKKYAEKFTDTNNNTINKGFINFKTGESGSADSNTAMRLALAASGAVMGIEKDDEGKYTFNIAKAAAGMALMSMTPALIAATGRMAVDRYKSGIVAGGGWGKEAPEGGKAKRPAEKRDWKDVVKNIKARKEGGAKLPFETLGKKIYDSFKKVDAWIENQPRTDFQKANWKRSGGIVAEVEGNRAKAMNYHKKIYADVEKQMYPGGAKTRAERLAVEKQQDIYESAATFVIQHPDGFGTKFMEDYAAMRLKWKAHDVPLDSRNHMTQVINEARKPSAMTQKIVADLKDGFLNSFALGTDEGLLRKFRDNYITQMWQMTDVGGAKVPALNIRRAFKYSKERTIENYMEGMGYGFLPKTMNAVDINHMYQNEFARQLYTNRFVQELSNHMVDSVEGRRPMVLSDIQLEKLSPELQRGYTVVDAPAFTQYFKDKGGEWRSKPLFVEKSVAKQINTLFAGSKLKEMPATREIMKINGWMKISKLALSGFHFLAMGNNAMYNGAKSAWGLGNPLPFDIGGWKSLYKQGIKAYRDGDPILHHLMKEGGVLIGESGSRADYVHKSADHAIGNFVKMVEKTGAQKIAGGIGKAVHFYDKAMWDEYYTGVKASLAKAQYIRRLKMGQHNPKLAKLYDEWRQNGYKMSGETEYEKVCARLVGRDSGRLIGGLNTELLGISETTWDAAKTVFLAPDWNLGNWLTVLSQMRELTNFKAGSLRSSPMAQDLVKTALYLGTIGYALNKASTGHGQWGNPNGVRNMVAIGEMGTDEMMYMDIWNQFGEPLKVYKYTGGDQKDKGMRYLYDAPLHYLVNKGSQVTRVMNMIISGEDWRGRPLPTLEELKEGKLSGDPWQPKAERGSVLPGVLTVAIGETFIPIPISQMGRLFTKNEPWPVAVGSIGGLQIKVEPRGKPVKAVQSSRTRGRDRGRSRGR